MLRETGTVWSVGARRLKSDAYFHCHAHKEREKIVLAAIKKGGFGKSTEFADETKAIAAAQYVRNTTDVDVEISRGFMLAF